MSLTPTIPAAPVGGATAATGAPAPVQAQPAAVETLGSAAEPTGETPVQQGTLAPTSEVSEQPTGGITQSPTGFAETTLTSVGTPAAPSLAWPEPIVPDEPGFMDTLPPAPLAAEAVQAAPSGGIPGSREATPAPDALPQPPAQPPSEPAQALPAESGGERVAAPVSEALSGPPPRAGQQIHEFIARPPRRAPLPSGQPEPTSGEPGAGPRPVPRRRSAQPRPSRQPAAGPPPGAGNAPPPAGERAEPAEGRWTPAEWRERLRQFWAPELAADAARRAASVGAALGSVGEFEADTEAEPAVGGEARLEAAPEVAPEAEAPPETPVPGHVPPASPATQPAAWSPRASLPQPEAPTPGVTPPRGVVSGRPPSIPARAVAVPARVPVVPAHRPAGAAQPIAGDARPPGRGAAYPTPSAAWSPPSAPQPPARGTQPPSTSPQVSSRAAQPPPASAQAAPPDAPPLPETTRRFLQPLVGVDPGTVRVRRDQQAQQVAAAFRADAVTIGDDVLLGPGHDEETPERPETLGVLAHELTHVARQRAPLFVPPVARPSRSPDGSILPGIAVPSSTPQGGVVSGGMVEEPPRVPGDGGPVPTDAQPASSDGEALARAVEARVIGVARGSQADKRVLPPEGEVAGVPTEATDRPGDASWNGLPAPWEPLPDWLAATSATGDASSGGVGSAYRQVGQIAVAPVATPAAPVSAAPVPAAPVPAAPVPAGFGMITAMSAGPVEAAESGRSLPAEGSTPDAAGTPEAGTGSQVEPDLDALSRRVYAILRRRLAAEARRSG